MSVCFTARCAATPAGIVARRAPPRFADRSLVTTPSTSYAHHQKRRGAVAAAAGQGTEAVAAALPQLDASLDDRLSQRPLELDPAGYFIIKVDAEAKELVADFYTNFINEQGGCCWSRRRTTHDARRRLRTRPVLPAHLINQSLLAPCAHPCFVPSPLQAWHATPSQGRSSPARTAGCGCRRAAGGGAAQRT